MQKEESLQKIAAELDRVRSVSQNKSKEVIFIY